MSMIATLLIFLLMGYFLYSESRRASAHVQHFQYWTAMLQTQIHTLWDQVPAQRPRLQPLVHSLTAANQLITEPLSPCRIQHLEINLMRVSRELAFIESEAKAPATPR